jgi:thiosulfate/3-mercaptopyruvate sulfurtransferase
MNPDTGRQWVAIGAMVVAIFTAIGLGSGAGGSGAGGAPESAAPWADAIESGADHVDASDLAPAVMAARGDLLLVDVRPADEYAAFHLPGAVNLTVPQLLGAEGGALLAGAWRQVVLYSNGPAHPAQAWVELVQRGHRNVRVLDGGLDEFQLRVLTPPSLRADVSEAQSAAEAATFQLRRVFFGLAGGAPSATTWATDPPALTAPTVVSTRWLAAILGKVAVVDVRERAADHAALHLPTAVHLPVASLRSKHGKTDLMLLDADLLAQRFGALGIGAETPVVVYAQDKLQDATLAILAFLRTGHTAVAILEGGIQRWAAERRPLVADPPQVAPVQYRVRPGADVFTISTDEVAALVQNRAATVLDVRPPEFFRGEKSTEARPGHIPGAVNRHFQRDLLRADDGLCFRPRDELLRDYAALGLGPEQPVVVSCRTGHQASQAYFVLRHLLGFRDVRWHNGSWTEWAERADLPAALGDQ